MSRQVQLDKSLWEVGDRIGQGGFGSVYEAESEGIRGVLKFVPKVPGADRELLFATVARKNVVPIVDTGEYGEDWVLAMPRARESLADYIQKHKGQVPEKDTLQIMTDVAEALNGIHGEVVHRDIKPANVLLLEGSWCLSDFGISRYAESSTDAHTRKQMHTAPYTAPERWRFETATGASDMYSFGVMAYQLLAGQLPFLGPQPEDYRHQHLTEPPETIPGVTPPLDSLVRACLHKAPEARPSPRTFLKRLKRIAGQPLATGGILKLQQANQLQISKTSEATALQERERNEELRRAELLNAAKIEFSQISSELRTALSEAAPDATIRLDNSGHWTASMNGATLEFKSLKATSDTWWGDWTKPKIEVIANSSIKVLNPRGHQFSGRGHSLWYCDAISQGEFHWYETAFMNSPLVSRTTTELFPDAFDPAGAAARAIWSGMSEYQVAWPFTLLVPGDLEDFIDRWGGWFADAVTGHMQHPHQLPEKPVGTWRK